MKENRVSIEIKAGYNNTVPWVDIARITKEWFSNNIVEGKDFFQSQLQSYYRSNGWEILVITNNIVCPKNKRLILKEIIIT